MNGLAIYLIKNSLRMVQLLVLVSWILFEICPAPSIWEVFFQLLDSWNDTATCTYTMNYVRIGVELLRSNLYRLEVLFLKLLRLQARDLV